MAETISKKKGQTTMNTDLRALKIYDKTPTNNGSPVLRAGILAYLDTFAGMIPCKVLRVTALEPIHTDGTVLHEATVRLTAGRRAYRRGEEFTELAHHVVPRSAVRWSKYGTRIMKFTIETTQ